MAQPQSTNTIFGDNNYGFQAGTITGSVTTEFHSHAPGKSTSRHRTSFEFNDEAGPPETPPSSLSIVLPFERDLDYIQRGSLLDVITVKLSPPAARVALVGLGGVGKSQLAIEFAYQLRRKTPNTWILWLYVSDDARFEQSVRNILDQLKVRGRNDQKANVFQMLYTWLCDVSHGPWLVILDNADDARVLLGGSSADKQAVKSVKGNDKTGARLDCIPRCDHGRVVVTSRTKEAARELVYDDQIIDIAPMEEEQALALLNKKLGRRYFEQNALQLARELDSMPLALTQAAAYIRQSDGRCSIQQYLEKLNQCDMFEANILDVDERDLRRDRASANSIMLTWQISFNRIRETHPTAADLLSLMSFFDRQAIPEALLRERESVNAADGAEKFEKDLAVLRNYCLIGTTTDPTIFEMHRLLQLATKRWLKANGQLERWGSIFVSNLDQAFPTSDFENWEICHSLYPHAIAARHTQVTCRDVILRRASLLRRSGRYASGTGSYTDAEKMLDEALGIRQTVLGEAHLDTLTAMLNLAKVYSQQGRFILAEELQMKVVEKRKQALGEEHPDTLVSMSSLVDTYLHQGKFDMAAMLELEVMLKKKRAFGEKHPETLLSISNLAGAYSHLGRWEEAEKLHMEVIEKDKEVLGEDDPHTLTGMNSLVCTWMRQERFDEAEKLQVTVLKRRQKVLGESHPDTLNSVSNLAWIYLKQKRVQEMEDLQKQVIEKRKRVLGEGHPQTLTSMATLAYMLRALHRRKSALTLMESCARDSQAIPGVEQTNFEAYCQVKEQWEREDALLTSTGDACSASDKPAAGPEKIKQAIRNAFAFRFR